MAITPPGVQPVVVNRNSPCGKITPEGALPAGGLAESPVTGISRATLNVQVGPPPVKLAVMVPVPVGDGPLNVVTTALGVTLTVADATLVPAEFVAVTEQV